MTNSDFDAVGDSDSGRREGRKRSSVQKITSVEAADQGGNGLFLGGLALIVVAGIAAVGFFAVNRESNIGIEPRAGNLDHWHSAYLIHNCGQDLPVSPQFESDAGIHTHGEGLFHIHPTQLGAGRNATLGAYFTSGLGEITDLEYTPVAADPSGPMVEADGCDGEPAVLQVAVWDDAFDVEAEPTVYTENLADIRFDHPGQAYTIALLPGGADIPPPPPERIQALADTGTGESLDLPEEGTENDDSQESDVEDSPATDSDVSDTEDPAVEDIDPEVEVEDPAVGGTDTEVEVDDPATDTGDADTGGEAPDPEAEDPAADTEE